MNVWVYLGWGIVVLILVLIFILVCVGILLCVDQYFIDKRRKDDDFDIRPHD